MKDFFLLIVGSVVMFETQFLGRWDENVTWFCLVILASFLIEFMSSVVEKRTTWSGFFGWCGRQVTMIVFVGLAHGMDVISHTDSNIWRDAVIFFYIGVNMLSIVSHAKVLGVPVPEQVIAWIEKLQSMINGVPEGIAKPKVVAQSDYEQLNLFESSNYQTEQDSDQSKGDQ